MKVKSLFLMALAASMAFVSCDKSEEFAGNTDTALKSVTVKLPNIKKAVSSRATGDAVVGGSQVSLTDYQVFFLDASGSPVTVPEFPKGTKQQVYFSSEDGTGWDANVGADNKKTYHYLPAATAKVVVVGNMGEEITDYTTIDGVADAALKVLNDGTPNDDGYDDKGHPYYPLYGTSDLTRKDQGHTVGEGDNEETHNNVYEASVNLVPRISRFEIYGFQYKLADNAELETKFTFEKVELNKIALANYYTTYDFVSMAPTANTLVSAPAASAEIWDWIGAAQTPWANAFSAAFEVLPNKSKFANGDDFPENYTAKGEGAEDIFTYGLTHVTDANKNPELLLSFYGVNGTVKTPLYLHGKFTQKAFAAVEEKDDVEVGKIYRVLFPIVDGAWDQPERCVELTVEVAEWDVETVTPEF